MRVQCKVGAAVDLREDDSTIPVATSHDRLSFIQDQDRLIKLLDAPVDLVDSTFDTDRGKLELAVTTQGEGSRWVQVVGPWEPHEMLHEAIFGSTDDLLFADELGIEDCLLIDGHHGGTCSLCLLCLLDRLLVRHWLEYF